jgi:transposase InsO family protein
MVLFFGEPLIAQRKIARETGVNVSSLSSWAERCLREHEDGRIYGFRALIPHLRTGPYVRTADVTYKPGSQVGAFTWLLARYPDIEAMLRRAFAQRNRAIKNEEEVRKPMRDILQVFLRKCKECGLGPGDYPFCARRKGIRSLYAFFDKLSKEDFNMYVEHHGGQRVDELPDEVSHAPAASRAFEVVEFDGHKIDLRLTVEIMGPSGVPQVVEIPRIWILVILDVATRCVIGYHIAPSPEYSRHDIAAAMRNALEPFVPKTYRIPGLRIKEGGGFPSNVVPSTAYACWDWFKCDNAKAHKAASTLERLTQVVGCWTHIGRPGEPNDRPFIERFFHLISRHFAHRLPGTVGHRPDAIEKALGDPKGNLRLLMTLDELNEMVEVLIANYNGEGHGSLDGHTPLQVMAYHMQRYSQQVRTLPLAARGSLWFLHEAKSAVIKGNGERGLRPYVNFYGVRYTSHVLASSPALVGRTLRLYFDIDDLRSIQAYFDDGSELGKLTAARPWSVVPHSLKTRQEIQSLVAEGRLVMGENETIFDAWTKMRLSKLDKKTALKLAKHQKAQANARQAQEEADLAPESEVPHTGIEPANDETHDCGEGMTDQEIKPIELSIGNTAQLLR